VSILLPSLLTRLDPAVITRAIPTIHRRLHNAVVLHGSRIDRLASLTS